MCAALQAFPLPIARQRWVSGRRCTVRVSPRALWPATHTWFPPQRNLESQCGSRVRFTWTDALETNRTVKLTDCYQILPSCAPCCSCAVTAELRLSRGHVLGKRLGQMDGEKSQPFSKQFLERRSGDEACPRLATSHLGQMHLRHSWHSCLQEAHAAAWPVKAELDQSLGFQCLQRPESSLVLNARKASSSTTSFGDSFCRSLSHTSYRSRHLGAKISLPCA